MTLKWGEHCLPVSLIEAWWALNVEQREVERTSGEKEVLTMQTDFFSLNPCIKLGQSTNCHSPSLLHSFSPTHTHACIPPYWQEEIERPNAWCKAGRGWTGDRRRQRRIMKWSTAGLNGARLGVALKKKGKGGLERSWAQQRLKTFWDSICIPSHDPLQKRGTLVLGVRRDPLKKRMSRMHPHKESKPAQTYTCKLISALVWQPQDVPGIRNPDVWKLLYFSFPIMHEWNVICSAKHP